MASPVRVLIVEDSPVVQRLLEHVIESDSRLAVAGVAGDAQQAMRMITAIAPDVVTMDIRLPGINGLELTRRIMQEHPLPIVVVAADIDDASLLVSMNALKAGALTVVEKPRGLSRSDYESLAKHLCTQLWIMSQVKVVRQRPMAAAPPTRVLPPGIVGREHSLVGIVASTGGPGALARVLGALPPTYALPLVVVQHMEAPFVAAFAAWLHTVSALPVALARDGERPQAGHVHLAPGDVHLEIGREGKLHYDHSPPVDALRPAGDKLLASMAAQLGQLGIGVVLTGMGQDGAHGLLALRQAGGFTIAEDKSTAVIWGMPGAAIGLGAAMEALPLDAIASRLTQLGGTSQPGKGGRV